MTVKAFEYNENIQKASSCVDITLLISTFNQKKL
jgi:hypothetical protein